MARDVDQMTDDETRAVSAALAEAFDVPAAEVSSSFIGPSWGQDVTRQSLWGLAIFLALTFVILALYFRTWKMSVAAIIGLVDVLVVTVGVYALFGFEISPAAVIGFLWLSTVPPTNALVAQIFGVEHLSMLGGMAFFSHQIGSFLGVWLGGELYDRTGSYQIVWLISIALGVLAALVNLPIREAPLVRAPRVQPAA